MPIDGLEDLGLSGEDLAFLQRFRFDEEAFLTLRQQLRAGDFPIERNQVAHPATPPDDDDLLAWPEPGTPASDEWERLGREAIEAGQVAVAVLNGGMASRFGGRVKGVVEVIDGASFLALKLRDVASAPGQTPVFVMTSFATHADTQAHLKANRFFGLGDLVTLLMQRISMRLTASGDIAKTDRGGVDFYAPGHGDIFEVLAESDAFARFVDAGGRAVMVSNIDNLGATLSPKVIGAHLASATPVTVEVAPRASNDKGGAPLKMPNRVAIVEGFCFPPGLDIATIPVFNTNTLVIDAEAMRPDYPLSWFRIDTESGGHRVVEFERLMAQVTACVDSTFLKVPRVGSEGRFLPVKTPDDLIAVRPAVRERFSSKR